MINTGIRPKKIAKKIQYPYSFVRLKSMAEKYKINPGKKGLSEVRSLGMSQKDIVKFIQDIELTFGINLSDSDLSTVGNLLSLDQVISKKVKK